MAHHKIKSSYAKLTDRLNRFPQGAPPSDMLYRILAMLFSEKEAARVAVLPIKPFTAKKASRIWKMNLAETQKLLDELPGLAILVDIMQNGESVYVLPPPMAGFFEFYMMRIRKDIDQKVLSELFYQYMNVEEVFVRELFTRGETQLGRTFIHEPVLSNENALHMLEYERASEVIKSASHCGAGICYCRHKMDHLDKACDARRFAILNPVHTTNFMPAINTTECNGCGKCVTACPVEAMTLVSANDPHRPETKVAKLDEDVCLGLRNLCQNLFKKEP